jgi:hypothetical protein
MTVTVNYGGDGDLESGATLELISTQKAKITPDGNFLKCHPRV